jgi:hypothetical protein
MPVNFFATHCDNQRGNCQTDEIKCFQPILQASFGISDEDGGNNIPAKVKLENIDRGKCFMVENRDIKPVTFKAIDWCIPIYRTGIYDLENNNRSENQFSSDNVDACGMGMIKRCEGFLQFENKILFIEIKTRPGGRGWLKGVREKFEETILSFREHHPDLADQIIKPIICNPSFSGPHQNETIQKEILKNKVRLEFVRQHTISI